jgi:hypothetical protein
VAGLKAPELSLEIFGAVITSDCSTFYPGLELLNNIICESEGRILPSEEDVKFTRYSHSFARRLSRDPELSQAEKASVVQDSLTEETIRDLLRCLEVDLEFTTKTPEWARIHFFPYTSAMSHWDARPKKGSSRRVHGDPLQVEIERRYFRGTGAYAYNTLRFDKNLQRLERIRRKLAEIFSKSDKSPLNELMQTLREHGTRGKAVSDEIECRSRLVRDDHELEEIYRASVDNLLGHNLPSAVLLRSLVRWTGLWFIFMSNYRAVSALEGDSPCPFIVDCQGGNNQLRKASQKSLKDFLSRIESGVKFRLDGREMSATQEQKIKSFYTSSLAGLHVINALKGRRHFTLDLDCVETLVLAQVPPKSDMPFDEFMHEILYKRLRLVIGRKAAEEQGLLSSLDASIFEQNEKALSEKIGAVGYLTVYSDATRMVGLGVLDE